MDIHFDVIYDMKQAEHLPHRSEEENRLGLKMVNDTYGHCFGDMLMVGGDAFMVIPVGGNYGQYPHLLLPVPPAPCYFSKS